MADEPNSDKLIERQLKLFQFIISALGIFIILSFGVVGFFQIKSATEVSAAVEKIKQKSDEDIKNIVDRLDNILPRYDERIDRLEDKINNRVDKKLDEITERFNEIAGNAPKPAELNFYLSGKLLGSAKKLKIKPIFRKKNVYKYKLPIVTMKNDGGSTTGTIVMYMLSDKQLVDDNVNRGYPYGYWNEVHTTAPEPFSIRWKFNPDRDMINLLNPGEYWEFNLPSVVSSDSTSSVRVKLQAFYGREPVESELIINGN